MTTVSKRRFETQVSTTPRPPARPGPGQPRPTPGANQPRPAPAPVVHFGPAPINRARVAQVTAPAATAPPMIVGGWNGSTALVAAPSSPTVPASTKAPTAIGAAPPPVLSTKPPTAIGAAPSPPAASAGDDGPPPVIIPIDAPVPPTITLSDAQTAVATAPTDPSAAAFLQGTAISAATGHAIGQANAAVLSIAARLQTMAAFVAQWVSPEAAQAVLTGVHLAP